MQQRCTKYVQQQVLIHSNVSMLARMYRSMKALYHFTCLRASLECHTYIYMPFYTFVYDYRYAAPLTQKAYTVYQNSSVYSLYRTSSNEWYRIMAFGKEGAYIHGLALPLASYNAVCTTFVTTLYCTISQMLVIYTARQLYKFIHDVAQSHMLPNQSLQCTYSCSTPLIARHTL